MQVNFGNGDPHVLVNTEVIDIDPDWLLRKNAKTLVYFFKGAYQEGFKLLIRTLNLFVNSLVPVMLILNKQLLTLWQFMYIKYNDLA